MQLFFQGSITSPTTDPNEEESKNLVRVLRKKQGDQVLLMDLKGILYTCVLDQADPKKASLIELSSKEADNNPF